MSVTIIVGFPRTLVRLPVGSYVPLRICGSLEAGFSDERVINGIVSVNALCYGDVANLLIEFSFGIALYGMIELGSVLDKEGVGCRSRSSGESVGLAAVPFLVDGGV